MHGLLTKENDDNDYKVPFALQARWKGLGAVKLKPLQTGDGATGLRLRVGSNPATTSAAERVKPVRTEHH
jgi:hypothetical protein